MAHVGWRKWLNRLVNSSRKDRRSDRSRGSSRTGPTQRLMLEPLEDRTLLAASITVIVAASGTGTQDANLLADGQILFSDPDLGANTVSTGALAQIAATTNITIQATNSITFNDIGTLTLQTGLGSSAAFSTATGGGGSIFFANQTNSLITSGGSLIFSAGADLTAPNLN